MKERERFARTNEDGREADRRLATAAVAKSARKTADSRNDSQRVWAHPLRTSTNLGTLMARIVLITTSHRIRRLSAGGSPPRRRATTRESGNPAGMARTSNDLQKSSPAGLHGAIRTSSGLAPTIRPDHWGRDGALRSTGGARCERGLRGRDLAFDIPGSAVSTGGTTVGTRCRPMESGSRRAARGWRPSTTRDISPAFMRARSRITGRSRRRHQSTCTARLRIITLRSAGHLRTEHSRTMEEI